jgi:hypothetical protein
MNEWQLGTCQSPIHSIPCLQPGVVAHRAVLFLIQLTSNVSFQGRPPDVEIRLGSRGFDDEVDDQVGGAMAVQVALNLFGVEEDFRLTNHLRSSS